jgi:hypothetical protein
MQACGPLNEMCLHLQLVSLPCYEQLDRLAATDPVYSEPCMKAGHVKEVSVLAGDSNSACMLVSIVVSFDSC